MLVAILIIIKIKMIISMMMMMMMITTADRQGEISAERGPRGGPVYWSVMFEDELGQQLIHGRSVPFRIH